MKLISRNPSKDFEKLGEVEVSSGNEIKGKVELAQRAKLAWKDIGVQKRIQLLKSAYSEFEKRKEELALIITREVGKPISESRKEIERGLAYFKNDMENGPEYLADEIIKDKQATSRVVYEPLGVAAVILPWNYPFMLFAWGVIPNLIAGKKITFMSLQ